MALSEKNKIDIRRHLGFGPVGDPSSPLMQGGSFVGYRYFQVQGLLEFRILNMSAGEEDALRGSGDPDNPGDPHFIDPETEKIIDGYITICNFLEGKIATSTDNLDIEKAGDYTARKDEVSARSGLYKLWVIKMAQFLYLPLGKSMVGMPGQLIS